MSVDIMSKIWKTAPYYGNRLLCLLACADWANDEGDFYPSYNKIGTKLRIERRSAIRLMAEFVTEGIITKTHRKTKSINSSNLFRLHATQCEDWEEKCPHCRKFKALSDTFVTEKTRKKESRMVTTESLGSDTSVTKDSDSSVTHIRHVEPSLETSLFIGELHTPQTPSESFDGKPVSLLSPHPQNLVEVIEMSDGRSFTIKHLGNGYIQVIDPLHSAETLSSVVHAADSGEAKPAPDTSDPPPKVIKLKAPPGIAAFTPEKPVLAFSGDEAGQSIPQAKNAQPAKRRQAKQATTKRPETPKPEEVERKKRVTSLLDFLATATGQPIVNYAAQGKAVKTVLGAGYTPEQMQEVLKHQLDGNWRGPVSWLSVQSQIADYFRRKHNNLNNGGTYNGTTINRRHGSDVPVTATPLGADRKPGHRFLELLRSDG